MFIGVTGNAQARQLNGLLGKNSFFLQGAISITVSICKAQNSYYQHLYNGKKGKIIEGRKCLITCRWFEYHMAMARNLEDGAYRKVCQGSRYR